MTDVRPCLGVKDLERELKFFTALGFEIAERWEAGAIVALDAIQLMLEPYEALRVSDGPLLDWDRSPSQLGAGLQLYLMIDDVDAFAAKVPVGIPRPWPVQDKPWGLRELTLKTPSGYLLTFARPARR